MEWFRQLGSASEPSTSTTELGSASGPSTSATEVSPPKIKRVESTAKLVLRADVALDSKWKGELPRGQCLLLIDELMDPSGVVRARVARESSPRGICVAPLGWVTALRDGEAKLKPIDGSVIGSKRTARSAVSFSPSSPGSDDTSMAARIAMRRRQSAAEREAKREQQSSAEEAVEPAAATPSAPAVSFKFVWMSAPGVHSKLAELRETIACESGGGATTLAGKLGRHLYTKKVSLDALMNEWDRNKDGDLSRMEFRMHVRKLNLEPGDKPTEIADCDALFDQYDPDGCVPTRHTARDKPRDTALALSPTQTNACLLHTRWAHTLTTHAELLSGYARVWRAAQVGVNGYEGGGECAEEAQGHCKGGARARRAWQGARGEPSGGGGALRDGGA